MRLKEKLKDKKRIQLFILLILLNFLSFGFGFLIGSKFLISNPIIINEGVY